MRPKATCANQNTLAQPPSSIKQKRAGKNEAMPHRKTHRLTIRQLIHRLLRNIHALRRMVDGEDVHLLARLGVLDLVALAAGGRVPAGDIAAAANVREARDLALRRPAVAGHETVRAIGAGDDAEAATRLRIAWVVGEGDGLGEREEEGED